MRSSKLFGCIVLLCVPAFAGEVRVGRPLTSVVPTLQHLHDACGESGKYDACTRFVAYRLEASCVEEKTEWRVRVSATFTPAIFLYNVEQLPHELDHVRDVRETLGRYVNEIERMKFASQNDCEAKALSATRGFEEEVRTAAFASNLARHPAYYKRASTN